MRSCMVRRVHVRIRFTAHRRRRLPFRNRHDMSMVDHQRAIAPIYACWRLNSGNQLPPSQSWACEPLGRRTTPRHTPRPSNDQRDAAAVAVIGASPCGTSRCSRRQQQQGGSSRSRWQQGPISRCRWQQGPISRGRWQQGPSSRCRWQQGPSSRCRWQQGPSSRCRWQQGPQAAGAGGGSSRAAHLAAAATRRSPPAIAPAALAGGPEGPRPW